MELILVSNREIPQFSLDSLIIHKDDPIISSQLFIMTHPSFSLASSRFSFIQFLTSCSHADILLSISFLLSLCCHFAPFDLNIFLQLTSSMKREWDLFHKEIRLPAHFPTNGEPLLYLIQGRSFILFPMEKCDSITLNSIDYHHVELNPTSLKFSLPHALKCLT